MTAPDPLREDEVMHGGGPHEWGYRDVATGEFIHDEWPFFAMDALEKIAKIPRSAYEAARIARAAILRLDQVRGK